MSGARRNTLPLWWLAIPVLTVLIQFANKMIAVRTAGIPFGPLWFEQVLRSPWTALMILEQAISLFLWLRILSTVQVSKALPLTAVSYILIIAMSYVLLGETIKVAEIGGTVLILAGVAMIASGERREVGAHPAGEFPAAAKPDPVS